MQRATRPIWHAASACSTPSPPIWAGSSKQPPNKCRRLPPAAGSRRAHDGHRRGIHHSPVRVGAGQTGFAAALRPQDSARARPMVGSCSSASCGSNFSYLAPEVQWEIQQESHIRLAGSDRAQCAAARPPGPALGNHARPGFAAVVRLAGAAEDLRTDGDRRVQPGAGCRSVGNRHS